MTEKDPLYSPTPKGENLSDYAIGRDDVEEMNETLRDIGYAVEGSRKNPFNPEGPTDDFSGKRPDAPSSENKDSDDYYEGYYSEPAPKNEELEQDLVELRRLVTLWESKVEKDEDGEDVDSKIVKISAKLKSYGKHFIGTEYHERYKELKMAYDAAAKRERDKRHAERTQGEISRLRRGING